MHLITFFINFALAGQMAASSQGPSETEQEVLPPRKPRKRGRPRKTTDSQDKTPAKMNISATSEAPVNRDSPDIPESPEMTPSGRPKRRAAKV